MNRIVDQILSSKHKEQGLSLIEDEHFLTLKQNGKQVAVWNAPKATIINIIQEANRYI
jgi:hypothetical protein